MVESKDKGVPLMKPTFFEKNDPNNPKYEVGDTPLTVKQMTKSIKKKIRK